MAALLFSAVLMALSAALLAQVGRCRHEQFWIFVAALPLQLGICSLLTSIVNRLEPTAWLVVQVGLLLTGIRLARSRAWRSPEEAEPVVAPSRSWIAWTLQGALILALVIVLGISACVQWHKPINDFDSLGYHASRCLYWIQQQSILPFETHNDRQTDFPFGGELFFLWPVLFTQDEAISRLIFWLALPLGVAGIYSLIRQLGVGRTTSLAGALVYATTPCVLTYATQLKPEMWVALFMMGTAFWVLHAVATPARRSGSFFWAGLFLSLGVNVRFTGLALLPSLLLLTWLFPGMAKRGNACARFVLGAMAGLLLSGLALVLAHNMLKHGRPFGGPQSQRYNLAEVSPHQLAIHSVRVPFFLFDLPMVPERAQELLGRWGANVADRCGATAWLDMESDRQWPGCFTFSVPRYAEHFSLGGMLWLAGTVTTAVLLIRCLCRRQRLNLVLTLAMLSCPMFLSVVFLVRWMVGMERFWIGAYALGLPLGVALLSRWTQNMRWLQIGMLAALTVMVWLPMPGQSPLLQRHAKNPYPAVLDRLPQRSRILLIAGQGFLDYPLFGPRCGYPNLVIPWGQRPWDRSRMSELLDRYQISHILMEDSDLFFLDGPLLDTAPFKDWIGGQPGISETRFPDENLRLVVLP